MTLLSRAKAMPLPEHTMDMHMIAIPMRCRDDARRYAENHTRAAREQIAAEGDAVIAKLCEALELIANTDPIDAALDPQRATEIARAALAEARKA